MNFNHILSFDKHIVRMTTQVCVCFILSSCANNNEQKIASYEPETYNFQDIAGTKGSIALGHNTAHTATDDPKEELAAILDDIESPKISVSRQSSSNALYDGSYSAVESLSRTERPNANAAAGNNGQLSSGVLIASSRKIASSSSEISVTTGSSSIPPIMSAPAATDVVQDVYASNEIVDPSGRSSHRLETSPIPEAIGFMVLMAALYGMKLRFFCRKQD